jgi:hypothetical protein
MWNVRAAARRGWSSTVAHGPAGIDVVPIPGSGGATGWGGWSRRGRGGAPLVSISMPRFVSVLRWTFSSTAARWCLELRQEILLHMSGRILVAGCLGAFRVQYGWRQCGGGSQGTNPPGRRAADTVELGTVLSSVHSGIRQCQSCNDSEEGRSCGATVYAVLRRSSSGGRLGWSAGAGVLGMIAPQPADSKDYRIAPGARTVFGVTRASTSRFRTASPST